jgi:class 3 adenylate cyclase
VVVDTTGEIFGDVPNIAARAQALAEPGAVVVTARAQRQVVGLFVAEERGSQGAGPHRTADAARASQRGDRIDAPAASWRVITI